MPESRGRKKKASKERRPTKVIRHTDGSRTIEMGDDAQEAMEAQLAAFRQKFGREPRPDDPLFFDPDEDEPTPLTALKIEAAVVPAMRAARIDPAYIYAVQQTGGVMPIAGYEHVWSDDDLAEFNDAMDRYRALHEDGDDDE